MRWLWKHALAAWVFVPAIGSLVAACYKPNVQDGGFVCADGGTSCPEGFHCGANGLCQEGPPPVCTAASPHVQQICAPDPGNDCDPLCQSRCECGRCNLAGATLACTPAGGKQRGEFCNMLNDDCVPGNVCLKDCSDKVARCFRFCGNAGVKRDDVCPGQCNFAVTDGNNNATLLTVCDPPAVQCNPVGESGDCGDAALSCYVLNTGATACDCKGVIAAGGECGPYNSCIPGYSCVSPSAGLPAACVRTCRLGGTDCAPAACVQAGPGNFGFCRP
jgi:hypothetical protein